MRKTANIGRLKAMANKSGVGARFAECSFDNYTISSQSKADEQSKVLEACRLFATNFKYVLDEGASLLLVGDTGTGKGHLSGAIVHEVISQGYSALFVKFIWMIEAIRGDYVYGESYNARLSYFAAPDLLVLDEMGMQRNTDDERLILERLIDIRYEAKKPTIFITNLNEVDFADLVGSRVISRLREQKIRSLRFHWEDYRTEFSKNRPSWMTVRQYQER